MPGRGKSRRSQRKRGEVYHLKLAPGDLPPTVIVPGDVDRVEKIAASWERSEFLARRRQFVSYRGRYHGAELGVVSSGIGGPAMSITVEELARLGVRTILRVGSCGALQSGMRLGDLVVTKAAVRFDGASQAYAPPGYPASADPEAYLALMDCAEELRVRHHGGITASFDTFYVGQARPGYQGFLPSAHRAMMEELRRLRVVSVEMEAATLLTVANVYGLRAGVVCAVYSVGDRDALVPAGEEQAIRVANEAARRLSAPRPPRRRSDTL
ncbi:MAG: nucleoside phosphorylase [Euryarchaeota archaeon]|nr:nucleoside phosphorylase [Euryarchaeota archaeon]MDE1836209.1 nucleoside phosphorylase [Euryarchaeota archaeon]MDE1881192.1 nucleoside phosphorylase [Euryarchaeota archaeon]MDE2045030.1 nucleoside phosphorylase [Thermoplasmata archaeon]